jgi:hypothetical protein
MASLLTKSIDNLASFFVNAPPLDPYRLVTLLSLTIGVVNLVRSVARDHSKAVEAARDRRRKAMAELKRTIVSRLSESDPRLLGARSVRSLAVALQKEYKAPTINDVLIAEAVRSAALKIEKTCSGDDLIAKLTRLNELLEELRPGGGTLLSFAWIDPVAAYDQSIADIAYLTRLAGFALVLIAIATVVWKSPFLLPLLALAVVVNLLLAVSGGRALGYWHGGEAKSGIGWATGWLLHPVKLSPLLDFFASVATNTGALYRRVWDVCWAPFMERRHIHQAYSTDIHMYRYFEAKPLMDALILASELRDENGKLPVDRRQECTALCRELWVLTGAGSYRELEKQAESGEIPKLGLIDLQPGIRIASSVGTDHMQAPVMLARRNELHHRLLAGDNLTAAEGQEYVRVSDALYRATGDEKYHLTVAERMRVTGQGRRRPGA